MKPAPGAAAGVFDRAASEYDRAAFSLFGPFGERLVGAAEIAPGERVLDVCCGTGAALLPAARAGARAVGLDISAGMVRRAATAAAAAALDVEVLVGDASDLPFADRSFDVVTCSLAFFLLPDPAAALAEMRRVIGPGGRVAVSAWRGWIRDEGWRFEAALLPTAELPRELLSDARRMASAYDTPAKLGAALGEAGFGQITIVEESLERAYATRAEWWAWMWSNGIRVLLEAMSPQALRRYRDACFAALGEPPTPAGWPRRFTAMLAIASR